MLFWETQKPMFFVGKRSSYTFPWTRDSQSQNSANSLAGNSQNAPPKFQPNLSAQAQKFRIFEKKLSLDVRCPWIDQILLRAEFVMIVTYRWFKTCQGASANKTDDVENQVIVDVLDRAMKEDARKNALYVPRPDIMVSLKCWREIWK